jgi:hypothetical protein
MIYVLGFSSVVFGFSLCQGGDSNISRIEQIILVFDLLIFFVIALIGRSGLRLDFEPSGMQQEFFRVPGLKKLNKIIFYIALAFLALLFTPLVIKKILIAIAVINN